MIDENVLTECINNEIDVKVVKPYFRWTNLGDDVVELFCVQTACFTISQLFCYDIFEILGFNGTQFFGSLRVEISGANDFWTVSRAFILGMAHP